MPPLAPARWPHKLVARALVVASRGQGGYHARQEVSAMRTNIVLDDRVIGEAMRLTAARTKREVVDLALRELVARHHQRSLRELVGRNLIDPDYDLLQVRREMADDPG